MDLFLRHVATAAALAYVDALGIAPRHGKNLRAHQLVMQDHVRLVQHAQRLQGEQAGMTGTGADQRDRTRSGDGLIVTQRVEQCAFRLLRLRAPKQRQHGAIVQPVVEGASIRKVSPPSYDALAMTLRYHHQGAQRVVQHLLQRLTDTPRQRGCRTGGGNGHDQWRAIHYGGHVEARKFGIVHHVD